MVKKRQVKIKTTFRFNKDIKKKLEYLSDYKKQSQTQILSDLIDLQWRIVKDMKTS